MNVFGNISLRSLLKVVFPLDDAPLMPTMRALLPEHAIWKTRRVNDGGTQSDTSIRTAPPGSLRGSRLHDPKINQAGQYCDLANKMQISDPGEIPTYSTIPSA